MTVLLVHSPTPAGEAAFSAAVRQSRYRSTDLVLINSPRGDLLIDDNLTPDPELQILLDDAARNGVRVTVERPTAPDLALVVLNAAERHEADLVVIGIRQRSAVGKVLLGSAPQRILMDASCEVLAVKAPSGRSA